jgi:cell growth-regulating nucleolar protein
VRSITDKKKNLSNGVKKILETISSYDNIPRKKAKFLNFMKNSFRYMRDDELNVAWSLLEEAMIENKPASTNNQQNGAKANGANSVQQANGFNGVEQANGANGVQQANGKRKLDDEDEPANEPSEKKSKVSKVDDDESLVTTTSPEKFSWTETIRSILSAKNNEIKMKKLKRKVLKQYQSLTGSEWSDKVESKFNKKINKLKGVVVEDERVRLLVD